MMDLSEELQELLTRSLEESVPIDSESFEPETSERVRVMHFAVLDRDVGRAVAVRNFLEWVCSGSGRETATSTSS